MAQQTFGGVVGERQAGSSSGWTIASLSFSISRQISPSFAKERCGWSSLQALVEPGPVAAAGWVLGMSWTRRLCAKVKGV